MKSNVRWLFEMKGPLKVMAEYLRLVEGLRRIMRRLKTKEPVMAKRHVANKILKGGTW